MPDRPRTCGNCKWCQTQHPCDTYIIIWRCTHPVPVVHTKRGYVDDRVRPSDVAVSCPCFDMKQEEKG